jgi:hypothetical protein
MVARRCLVRTKLALRTNAAVRPGVPMHTLTVRDLVALQRRVLVRGTRGARGLSHHRRVLARLARRARPARRTVEPDVADAAGDRVGSPRRLHVRWTVHAVTPIVPSRVVQVRVTRTLHAHVVRNLALVLSGYALHALVRHDRVDVQRKQRRNKSTCHAPIRRVVYTRIQHTCTLSIMKKIRCVTRGEDTRIPCCTDTRL